MSPQQSRTGIGSLEQMIHDLVQRYGKLMPGEIVVHFDLVANTRRIADGRELIDRRRWSTPGSDPHLSYGVLDAEAKKIRETLT